ncbi:hypothetical protein BCR44DRAFT_1434274 [Catenaria anguillulae PL171]|uniref:Uncharacterized protein n=1 Tax=Catenaria anguillulae PL171 TaxID=765915 RepID=A0A1Y2HQS0_9FUNG|nr:hypothetical protein BCR44DRAFT_1434274 [Catenaria anguillulae PL171]
MLISGILIVGNEHAQKPGTALITTQLVINTHNPDLHMCMTLAHPGFDPLVIQFQSEKELSQWNGSSAAPALCKRVQELLRQVEIQAAAEQSRTRARAVWVIASLATHGRWGNWRQEWESKGSSTSGKSIIAALDQVHVGQQNRVSAVGSSALAVGEGDGGVGAGRG